MSTLARHAHEGGSLRVVVPLLVALLSALLLSTSADASFAQGRIEHPLALTQLPDLPLARDGAAAVATREALYVIGGATAEGPTGRIDRYTFASARWETLPLELLPRRHHAAVLVDKKLYVIGGRGAAGPVAAVEVIDLATGGVEKAAPMPTPRYFASAALYQGRIYVAGGTLGWGRMNVVESYDPVNDEWYVAAPLGVARDTQLVVARDKLYALGGYAGGRTEVSTVVERFDGRRWVKVADMPKPTSSFAATSAGGLIFTFGDHRHPGRVYRFSPESSEWTELEVGFFPRRHGAAAAQGGRVFVVGGSQRGNAFKLGTLELFDLSPGDTGTL